MYSAEARGPAVAQIVRSQSLTKKTVYKYLRRFWQGGCTKNALLPRFLHCGGRNKPKVASDSKRGRPRRHAHETNGARGINADEDVKRKFQLGFKKYYLGNLTDAYRKTLSAYFNIGYRLENGVLVPVLPDESELPSFSQFRYWHDKLRVLDDELKSISGERKFLLRHRAILGHSTQLAFGPGSEFQVDATIGDLYLVSVLDRSRIIGRPVIYFISDVFSRMVVGLSVSLEGPSWAGAMLALGNLVADKVEFCKQHGIDITPEAWPCHYLPDQLIADRGEFEGFSADTLVNSLGIQLSNTPPYRPDWKGIVEQNFNLVNKQLIHWLPGATYPHRGRGDKDYRLDACLTLPEFRQLMIWCVLTHNQSHRLRDYPLTAAMIQDHVEPYPLDLWNWGIVNQTGRLRTLPIETMRLNVLPRGEASVTRTGIRFGGLTYVSQRALGEQWSLKARNLGGWKIPVAYDPHDLSIIYWCPKHQATLEPLELIEQDATFRNCNYYEVSDHFELQRQAHQVALPNRIEAEAKLAAQVKQVVDNAQAHKAEAIAGLSKAGRLKGIHDNRQQERQLERQNAAGPTLSATHSPILPAARFPGYVPPPQFEEEIRASLEEGFDEQSD